NWSIPASPMIRSRTSSRSRRPSGPRSLRNSLKSGRQPIGKHRETWPSLISRQAVQGSGRRPRLDSAPVDRSGRASQQATARTRLHKTNFQQYCTGVWKQKVDFELFSRHNACGRRGRAGQETTARTSLYKTYFSPVLDRRTVKESRDFWSSGSRLARTVRLLG